MSTEEQISNIHKEETVREEGATYKPHADPKKVKAAKEASEQHGADSFQAAAPPAAKKDSNSQQETEASSESGNDYQKLLAEYNELDDKYKRLWADQQNMVKRNAREREELYKYAAVSTVEAILPALDNFDFALKSINDNTSTDEVLKGIELLRSQMMMALQSVGLEEITPTGLFDPGEHEAISKVKDPEKEEGSIVDVVKKGFKLKDKVIRAATVVVSTKSD